MLRARRAVIASVVVIITGCGLAPSADAAPKGEPTTATVEPRLLSDPNVVWVGTWESTDWKARHGVGSFDNAGNTSVLSPTTTGTRGKTLSGRTPARTRDGFSYHASFDRAGFGFYDELYFRYRVLFPSWYQWKNGRGGGGGKLPGLAGKSTGGNTTNLLDKRVGSGGRRYNGTTEVTRSNLGDADGWSARLLWEKDGGLSSYIYAVSPVGPSSEKSYFGYAVRCKTSIGSSTNKLFSRGAWNTVEMRVRMNTPGVNNGIFQVWMNGSLCIDLKSVQWRSAKRTTLRITQMYTAWFYGGGTSDFPDNDSRIYIDDAVLSKAYVGPRQG